MNFNEINKILEQKNDSNYCISLDWLSMYFKNVGLFESEYKTNDEISLSEDIKLTAIDRPTLHFKTHFELFYKKEVCAHILIHPRSDVFFAPDTVKVEFSNHTLYSGVWQDIYNALQQKGLKYTSCSRIDIAIDGVAYLHKLMNIYAKQRLGQEQMLLKNSSEKRSIFSAKVLNPSTRNFENFNIGHSSVNKMITIYNKSLEIVKSQKNYIQEYWLKNKVVNQLQDLPKQLNDIKTAKRKGIETQYIKGQENIYRFEIRLKSESIKELKTFTPEMLTTPSGLMSMVKTHCQKYFEACLNDNKRITRCTNIDLLPYDKFGGVTIEKIKRVEKDGLYKSKLTIHGIIQDIYKGYVQDYRINEALEIIHDRVVKYSLNEYLQKKLPEWESKYKKFVDKNRHETINFVMSEISNNTGLAERHNQSYATAQFGD